MTPAEGKEGTVHGEKDKDETFDTLHKRVDAQHRQIVCLTGFLGTLLGALQTKSLLHPDDVDVLVELFEEIAPGAKDRAVQNMLRAVRITAEETPHMLELDGDHDPVPAPAPMHIARHD